MASSLWDREFRGAQRRRWRQPWTAPLAVVILVALRARFPSHALDSILEPEIIPGWQIPIAAPVLVLWAVWTIANAMIRDRRAGIAVALGMTNLSPRSIALAKTFAPSWPTLLVLAVLRWSSHPEIWFRDDESLLFTLGHFHTGEMIRYDLITLWRSTRALLLIAAVASSVLLVIAFAVLAAWVAARSRSKWEAVVGTLAILAILRAAGFGLHLVLYTQLFTVAAWQSTSPLPSLFGDFSHWAHAMVAGEMICDCGLRIGLPLLWLGYWWRWTRQGFADIYLTER
jgi:hypothetical protein